MVDDGSCGAICESIFRDGNNPINGVDPDGGSTTPPPNWIKNNKTGEIDWFWNDEVGALDKWGADADISTLSKDYFDPNIIAMKVENGINNYIDGIKWNVKNKWEQAKQEFFDAVPDGA